MLGEAEIEGLFAAGFGDDEEPLSERGAVVLEVDHAVGREAGAVVALQRAPEPGDVAVLGGSVALLLVAVATELVVIPAQPLLHRRGCAVEREAAGDRAAGDEVVEHVFAAHAFDDAIVAVADSGHLGREGELEAGAVAVGVALEEVAAVLLLEELGAVVVELEAAGGDEGVGGEELVGVGDLVALEDLTDGAAEALVAGAFAPLELLEAEPGCVAIDEGGGEVALAVAVGDGPGDGGRMLELLGGLVAPLHDAEEGDEERDFAAVCKRELAVEVPPLRGRRGVREVVERQINRASFGPVGLHRRHGQSERRSAGRNASPRGTNSGWPSQIRSTPPSGGNTVRRCVASTNALSVAPHFAFHFDSFTRLFGCACVNRWSTAREPSGHRCGGCRRPRDGCNGCACALVRGYRARRAAAGLHKPHRGLLAG